MRRTSLTWANVVLWAVIAALAVAYATELRWAATALGRYLGGEFPVLRESSLRYEAYRLIEEGGDRQRAADLLRQSLHIEPYTLANVLLARVHLEAGDVERAAALYARYLAIDAGHVESYVGLAEIHRLRGDDDARARVLHAGIRELERRVADSSPRADARADESENEKARQVHATYRQGLALLRQLQGPVPDGQGDSSPVVR